ncbi:MAG: hypothetical protein Q9166_003112 [cf. Caloplaca sp. 2 TL-2023]
MGSSTSAPALVDDASAFVDLPFPLQIGQRSSQRIYVTPNGVLSILDSNTEYINGELPTGNIPPFSLTPFWDDTIIYEGQPQGVFYKIDGGNQVVFEYYLSRYAAPTEFYHYLVSYSTSQPGVYTYTYYQVSDAGISATVGAQYDDSM